MINTKTAALVAEVERLTKDNGALQNQARILSAAVDRAEKDLAEAKRDNHGEFMRGWNAACAEYFIVEDWKAKPDKDAVAKSR